MTATSLTYMTARQHQAEVLRDAEQRRQIKQASREVTKDRRRHLATSREPRLAHADRWAERLERIWQIRSMA